MLYGVIDIGSNSVRLMIHDGIKTISKSVRITRLAEGMGADRLLSQTSVDRTVAAVDYYVKQCWQSGVNCICAFGTAALRQAKNSDLFVNRVKELCGVNVDIISGDTEAEIGVHGALGGKDGGVIDIGGASVEVIAYEGERKIYSKSLDIGVVKVKEFCGHNREKAERFIDKSIMQYGSVPLAKYYGIGGTATSIASILIGDEVYNPSKVNGFVITQGELIVLAEKLYSMSIDEISLLKGLQPERASVISGGCLILLAIMKKIGINEIIVSESDNLEGYLLDKMVKK